MAKTELRWKRKLPSFGHSSIRRFSSGLTKWGTQWMWWSQEMSFWWLTHTNIAHRVKTYLGMIGKCVDRTVILGAIQISEILTPDRTRKISQEIKRLPHLGYLAWAGICAVFLETLKIGMVNQEVEIRARVLPIITGPKFPAPARELRKKEKQPPDGSLTNDVMRYRS